ncbi:MAG: sugar transferase [Gemmatimonadetes bacterium]|nr:MAG: sugar transferase [Gemmatimonadota bacterium]
MLWQDTHHQRIAQVADLVVTALSFVVAYLIWEGLRGLFPDFPLGSDLILGHDHLSLMLFTLLIWHMILNYQRAYSYQRFKSFDTEIAHVLKTVITGIFVLLGYIFIFRVGYIPRTLIALFGCTNFTMLLLQRKLLIYIAAWLRQKGHYHKRILIVGWNPRTQQFLNLINTHPEWGLEPVGILTIAEDDPPPHNIATYVRGTDTELLQILHTTHVDEVIITVSTEHFGKIRTILELCEVEGVQTRIISNFLGNIAKSIHADIVYGLPIITIQHTYKDNFQLFIKRLLDVALSTILLVLLAPLLIIIAITIKLTSPGPILYVQDRVGLNGTIFRFYKFRSMVNNAEALQPELATQNQMSGPAFKLAQDPRITPLGRFLRRFSLDELPQLWNVLKGDMSLVGPRPPIPSEVHRYDNWQRRKLSVKPGLTCIWQVEGRNEISNFNDWVALDLKYIDSWSIWLDLKLLLKTIPAVLSGKGAH